MAQQHDPMYGISRIDDDRHHTHAWRVSIRRRGTTLVKNFPDRKFGGRADALTSAQAHRDRVVQAHPPLTRKEFAELNRRHNTSGITGVYRYAKTYRLADGRERKSWYWEAHWPTAPGQHDKATFAVNEHGESFARSLAIRARENGINRVEGVFWASERGPDAHCGR